MISKTIQKEKERQEGYLRNYRSTEASINPSEWMIPLGKVKSHEQSLINLKEYLEGRSNYVDWLLNEEHMDEKDCFPKWAKENMLSDQKEIKEDIEELTKMIKRYG